MITVKTENYNLISQHFYNKTIDSLDLNLISCACGHSGCLIRHGSYKRSIQLADRILSLSVVRVYCKICGHTHALLLSSMVPYSQIPPGPARPSDSGLWTWNRIPEHTGRTIPRGWKQPEIHHPELPLTLEAAAALHEALPPRYPQPDFRMLFPLFQTVHAD